MTRYCCMNTTAIESLTISRRDAVAAAAAILLGGPPAMAHAQPAQAAPEHRWYLAAAEMMRQAQASGDQPYGAVLVLAGVLIGEGPSRVIKNSDIGAHAEREAIRDAQQRLGRRDLAGSVLYSTSRPCGLCEAAAAQAGVSRMYHGPSLADAGTPRRGSAERM
jgi:tRNA(Arg) A34 adenosine deaminase TadA